MIYSSLSILAFANIARMAPEPAYRFVPQLREALGLEPDEAPRLNARMTFVGLIAADLVRFGGKMPWAVKIAGRIAETLLTDPDAAQVHIEFHQNGASFFFTSADAPDAASVSGPARFRLTFDLRQYWSVVDGAMAERAATAGGADEIEVTA